MEHRQASRTPILNFLKDYPCGGSIIKPPRALYDSNPNLWSLRSSVYAHSSSDTTSYYPEH